MPLPTFQQAKSFALAVLSGKDKKLQAERDAICNQCEHLVKHVTRNRYTNKLQVDSHCSKCGCGTRPMSGLRKNKNAYRKLSCPIKKWPGDKEDRGGLSIHDMSKLVNVYDRLEMQLATIQMHLDDGKPITEAQFSEMSGRELHQLRAMNSQNNAFPGAPTDPKVAAVAAAAARTKPRARPTPGLEAAQASTIPAMSRPHPDQIPDGLLQKHFRKLGGNLKVPNQPDQPTRLPDQAASNGPQPPQASRSKPDEPAKAAEPAE